VDVGFATLTEDHEREVLEIRLNLDVVVLATNKMFCIENTRFEVLDENKGDRWMNLRVVGVQGDLVLCSVVPDWEAKVWPFPTKVDLTCGWLQVSAAFQKLVYVFRSYTKRKQKRNYEKRAKIRT
jgi:hypothetical protein